jgi:galactofuranose transport system permease protein
MRTSETPLAAVGVALDAIAAVVIGGTLLTRGEGGIPGTFLGVMIGGLVQTVITFDDTLSSWLTKIAIGLLLIVFIAQRQGSVALAGRPGRARPPPPGTAAGRPAEARP